MNSAMISDSSTGPSNTEVSAAASDDKFCPGKPPDRDRSASSVVCLEVECQLASRLSLRICLSKARAGTMRRSVLTRPAVEPAV
jgi:hypothetical protein